MSEANKRKTPKTKPVYAWVAVWKDDGTLYGWCGIHYTKQRCVKEIRRSTHHLHLRPLRVLITPAKKGAKK